MSKLPFLFSVVASIMLVRTADALVIELDPNSSGVPPHIEFHQGDPLPLALTLRIGNDGALDSSPLLLWQFAMQLASTGSANGQLAFSSFSIPVEPLFGSMSNPGPPLENTSNSVVISDTDPEFMGVAVLAQSSRNVINLDVEVPTDALGQFELTAAGLVSMDPDHSSFWISAEDEDFEARSFDNALTGSQRILLATIEVIAAESLAGDYNHNGFVDAADYTVWRDTLGQMGLNLAADGDDNGVVNTLDYDVWNNAFPAGNGQGATVVARAVAEPTGSILILCPALLCLSRIKTSLRPRRSQRA